MSILMKNRWQHCMVLQSELLHLCTIEKKQAKPIALSKLMPKVDRCPICMRNGDFVIILQKSA